jgi:hypothetical protein
VAAVAMTTTESRDGIAVCLAATTAARLL